MVFTLLVNKATGQPVRYGYVTGDPFRQRVKLGICAKHSESRLNRLGRLRVSRAIASLARPSLIWRASEASETPSIATYKKKCLGVSTSKPQCACSQFYVKRRSGRSCIFEKPVCCSRVQLRKARFTRTSKRQSACTSNNFTFARPLMGTIF